VPDPRVSVRGEALSEVEPDIADIWASISARDKHRDETLRRLDDRSAAVLALVESFGAAVERVETDRVRIRPELKDGKPHERITGYAASVRHTITVTDFTRLGDLVARLAELEMVDVAGPSWRLRRDSPVYRETRMAAARDAVARGREYAEALGSRLTGVLEIADTGLLVTEDRAAPMGVAAPMRAMAAAGHAPEPVSLDLEPVRQVVRASVEARFSMAPPPDGTL
jgi:hypothetical protein